MSSSFDSEILYQGDIWRRVDTLPRFIAEGWQLSLHEIGVASIIRTPFHAAEMIPMVGTNYSGDVALYVPQIQWDEAISFLDNDDTSQNDPN